MIEPIEVEFVNREEELARFRTMYADPQSARILLIKGEAGMGKSWLLTRISQEHHGRQIGFVNLGHHFAQDPIALIRRLSEQISSANWQAVNALLKNAGKNYPVTLQREGPAHLPAKIEFRDHTYVSGDVVGGDKIIINMAGADDPLVREQLTAELSEAFIQALSSFQPTEPALILLDAYEKRTSVIEQWLLETFLPHIRTGTLKGVLVVIAGQDVPRFDRNWRFVIVSTELAGIPIEAFREYWVERRKLSEDEVRYAIRFSNRIPQLMALMADNSVLAS